MTNAEEGDVGILDFVLIARGGTKFREQVAGLGVEAGAIEAAGTSRVGEIAELRGGHGSWIGLRAPGERIGGEEALNWIGAESAIVGFGARNLMMPVRAGREIPAGTGAEVSEIVDLVNAGRLEQVLAGDTRVAAAVANGKAKLIGVAEAVTKITGEGAVTKRIVRTLAVGFEIGCRAGVVKLAEQP